jgi:hypothetical protein
MAAERKKPTGERLLEEAQANGYLTIVKGQPYGGSFVERWREQCEAQGRPAIHAVVSGSSARVIAVFDHLGLLDASQARQIAATLQGVEGAHDRPVRYFGGEYEYAGGGAVVRRRPEIEAHCSQAAVAEVVKVLNDCILDMAR